MKRSLNTSNVWMNLNILEQKMDVAIADYLAEAQEPEKRESFAFTARSLGKIKCDF